MSDNQTRQTLVQAGTQDAEIEARRIAEMELAPGEELLWADRVAPDWGLRAYYISASSTAVLSILTAVMAITLDWTFGWRAALVVLPFSLIPLISALIANAFGKKLREYRHTVYAITSHRILKITLDRGRSLTSASVAPLGQFSQIDLFHRQERPDGVGTLVFPSRDAPQSTPNPSIVSIEGVPTVRLAEQVLRLAIESGRAALPPGGAASISLPDGSERPQ